MLIQESRIEAILISQKILDQKIDPYDGAMSIWKQLLDNMTDRIPDDLWAFKSNASAIEDCLWNSNNGGEDNAVLIAQCKMEILEAAQQLIDAK